MFRSKQNLKSHTKTHLSHTITDPKLLEGAALETSSQQGMKTHPSHMVTSLHETSSVIGSKPLVGAPLETSSQQGMETHPVTSLHETSVIRPQPLVGAALETSYQQGIGPLPEVSAQSVEGSTMEEDPSRPSIVRPEPVVNSVLETQDRSARSRQEGFHQDVDWASFLPPQFRRVIQSGDQKWVAQCLYDHNGKFKDTFKENWFFPPAPQFRPGTISDPGAYFSRRLFLWAPMRMWRIPLKCPSCKVIMHHN